MFENICSVLQLNDYLFQINPEHTVPTLDDNGDIIWDSHAICAYLVDKYANDDSLYPKDLYLRARCNQRFIFDNSVLFPRFRALVKHVFGGGDSIPEDWIKSLDEPYALLEIFLSSNAFLVSDQLTLADICASQTTYILSRFAPLNEEHNANVISWLNRIKEEIPFYDEITKEYVDQFHEIITNKIESNKTTE